MSAIIFKIKNVYNIYLECISINNGILKKGMIMS